MDLKFFVKTPQKLLPVNPKPEVVDKLMSKPFRKIRLVIKNKKNSPINGNSEI